jgi:hypothetical protein
MRMRSTITAACSLAIAASFGFGVAGAGDPTPPPASASQATSANLTARADSAKAATIGTHASQERTRQASAKAPSKVTPVQSRTCLTTTGSLFTPKPGHCVNAFGNVYTQEDMWRTGRITPSGALRTLDPDVTLVH